MFICVVCHTRHDTHAPWCIGCGESGVIIRQWRRKGAAIDSIPEETDARSLSSNVWGELELGAYPDLKIGPGALVVVHGSPGAGKSTWAARALDTLRGPVLLVSVEEPPGPTLASRLARCSVKRSDFGIIGRASVDQIVSAATRRKVTGIVVDSVQIAMFTPRDLRHMLAVLPDLKVLIAVSQQNKTGATLGRLDLVHEADVVIRVDDGEWRIEKSRYQAATEVGWPVMPVSKAGSLKEAS